ncbi:hypothetical protein Tco_0020174, partial [Tanacetum coccineum]
DDGVAGGGWRGDNGWWWWRVEESEITGWIDRLTRIIFGVHRKTPPEKFSGGGEVVVAGMLAGEEGGGRRWGLSEGFCFICASSNGNSSNNDLNLNSFNDLPNDFTHPPQPQYETYLCELCGNDSHFGYDCSPRFPLDCPDYEDSRARGFVHRPLDLQSLACLFMGIRYPRSY